MSNRFNISLNFDLEVPEDHSILDVRKWAAEQLVRYGIKVLQAEGIAPDPIKMISPVKYKIANVTKQKKPRAKKAKTYENT